MAVQKPRSPNLPLTHVIPLIDHDRAILPLLLRCKRRIFSLYSAPRSFKNSTSAADEYSAFSSCHS